MVTGDASRGEVAAGSLPTRRNMTGSQLSLCHEWIYLPQLLTFCLLSMAGQGLAVNSLWIGTVLVGHTECGHACTVETGLFCQNG